MSEKSPDLPVYTGTGSETKTENRKWIIAIAIIATLSTTLVVSAVFVGILFSMKYTPLKESSTKTEKWVSWTRQAGDIEIHESALIDDERQTITMVSAEAYRINEENSVALHDFQKGYVALRDFKGKVCLVTKIENPSFQEMKKLIEKRKGKTLPLQPLIKGQAQSRNMTSSELGLKLSEFCEGVPAVWFDVSTSKDVEKRDTIVAAVVKTTTTTEVVQTVAGVYVRVTVKREVVALIVAKK